MKKLITLCLGILLMSALIPPLAMAQNGVVVSGVVVDDTGLPIIGATVLEAGTTNGTSTDIDGAFTLRVNSENSLIEVSYIGFQPFQRVAASGDLARVVLVSDDKVLDDVVVIGYGSVKKDDMTGSVVAVQAEELNRAALTSPQGLLQGKVPGVNITSASGAPGSGGEIRIRGGASLSANNNPLIVIDGVVIANEAGPGMSNALSTVNPNDIASFTVLKDASATAIYGSRASNGVIIITTKKGSGDKVNFSYNGSVSVKENANSVDVMSASELQNYISQVAPGSADAAKELYGTSNTDWQDEIYRLGYSVDHNMSLYGTGADGKLPYRVSMGYVLDQGTIKDSDNQRLSTDISLSPKFLDNHLTVNVNAKGVYNYSNYVDGGVVGSAVNFDPSQDIYERNADGSINRDVNNGYWNWGSNLADENPYSLLYDMYDTNKAYRFLGNAQLDYRVHGFEELRLNLNLGLDATMTNGNKGNRPNSIFANRDSDNLYKGYGRYTNYENNHRNKLLELYANYNKTFGSHTVDAMAGYSYADNYYSTDTQNYGRTATSVDEINSVFDASRNVLISYFGRLNYSYDSRYLLTFTMRADGSSRFVGDNRWGYFPSAAFAWNLTQESFLENANALSSLKLRLGWGITGQQDFSNVYAAQSYYITSQDPATQYPLGDGYYYPVQPQAYNPDLKWEETTTYNLGVDFGFFNGRISGSVDAYYRDTQDLLSTVDIPLGSNFSNVLLQNIGSMENQGLEMSLNFVPVQTDDWYLDIGVNGTLHRTEITSLPTEAINIGGAGGGTGQTVQRHQVGYTPYTFYTWQQVYDSNGDALQNALVDRDMDGVITNADRYMTDKSPSPDFYYGVSLKLSYKNWDFGFNGHGSVGNYMFNNVLSGSVGTYFPDMISKGYILNVLSQTADYGFEDVTLVSQSLSDLFLENASYFRMDDINLGYTFQNVANLGLKLRIAAGVQNAFVLTKYSGLDPESSFTGGIDSNIYPRPRIYSVRVGVNF